MARSPRTLSSQNPGGVVPDDVSKQIIEQLQQDGRRSYAAIGKAVGLSEAAVRQRVQRLTETGGMQIVAVADPPTPRVRPPTTIRGPGRGDPAPVARPRAPPREIR